MQEQKESGRHHDEATPVWAKCAWLARSVVDASSNLGARCWRDASMLHCTARARQGGKGVLEVLGPWSLVPTPPKLQSPSRQFSLTPPQTTKRCPGTLCLSVPFPALSSTLPWSTRPKKKEDDSASSPLLSLAFAARVLLSSFFSTLALSPARLIRCSPRTFSYASINRRLRPSEPVAPSPSVNRFTGQASRGQSRDQSHPRTPFPIQIHLSSVAQSILLALISRLFSIPRLPTLIARHSPCESRFFFVWSEREAAPSQSDYSTVTKPLSLCVLPSL